VLTDKPGGLVVDYLGLAHELKTALVTYTESGGTGRTAFDQEETVAVMQEKCDGQRHERGVSHLSGPTGGVGEEGGEEDSRPRLSFQRLARGVLTGVGEEIDLGDLVQDGS